MGDRMLSICMPSLLHRLEDSLMYRQIQEQIKDRGDQVEFFCLIDNGPMSTGNKMNALFNFCNGRYIAGVGDDDSIEPNYVEELLAAIRDHDVDVITFDHTYNVNGNLRAMTKQVPNCTQKMHRIELGDDYVLADRLPGPLCPVRSDLAKKFSHPNMSEKEDLEYKFFIRDNAKTYHNIDLVLYNHLWSSKNPGERRKLKKLWLRS